MNPRDLIDKYYAENRQAKSHLLAHSKQVTDLAVTVARHLAMEIPVDIEFVEQAAMLHDIGMLYTDTPALACHGEAPYIVHGILGAELLNNEGFPRHALACERHIGVGLTVEDIITQKLPLPHRDMRPRTTEEEIVAYADLFFSKTKPGLRTPEMVRKTLDKYGHYKIAVFDEWHKRFGKGSRLDI